MRGKSYKRDIAEIERRVWGVGEGWRDGGMVFNFLEEGGEGKEGKEVVLCVECKSVVDKEFVGTVLDTDQKKKDFLMDMKDRFGVGGRLLGPYSEEEVQVFEEKYDVVLPDMLRWYLVNVSRQLLSEVGGAGTVELSLAGLFTMRAISDEERCREIVEGIGEVGDGCDRGSETVLLRLLRHEGSYVHDLVVRGNGCGRVIYYKPRGGGGRCGFFQDLWFYLFDTVDTLHTIVGSVTEWGG